jgi:hypothetical protein
VAQMEQLRDAYKFYSKTLRERNYFVATLIDFWITFKFIVKI